MSIINLQENGEPRDIFLTIRSYIVQLNVQQHNRCAQRFISQLVALQRQEMYTKRGQSNVFPLEQIQHDAVHLKCKLKECVHLLARLGFNTRMHLDFGGFKLRCWTLRRS